MPVPSLPRGLLDRYAPRTRARGTRAGEVHLVLDTTPSMRLHGKGRFAEAAERLLIHLARYDAFGRVHLLGGDNSRPARSDAEIRSLRGFLERAPATALPEGDTLASGLAELIVR